MPVSVRHKPSGKTGPKGQVWAIVEKATGKVKGWSTSRAKAEASAAIRNREHRKKVTT